MKLVDQIKQSIWNIDPAAAKKLVLLSIVLVTASILMTFYIWEEQLNTRVEKAGIRWPALIILWKSLTILIAPLSGTITYVIAWWLYWVFWWNIYNIIWNAIWISIWFWLGRIWWIDAVTRLLWKKSADMVQDITERLEDIKTLAITRVILFPLEDLINFAWWMSKIRFPIFLAISLVITTMVAIVWVWFGDVLF